MSNLPRNRIEYMCRMGLAGDMARVSYYIEAMENPYSNVTDSFRREYVADVLNKILNIVAEDAMIYDHIISSLQRQYPNQARNRPWMGESTITSNLNTQATNKNGTFDTIKRVIKQ